MSIPGKQLRQIKHIAQDYAWLPVTHSAGVASRRPGGFPRTKSRLGWGMVGGEGGDHTQRKILSIQSSL